MKNTLFPLDEIEIVKKQISIDPTKKNKIRDPSGRYTTKAINYEFDRLKRQITTLIKQRKSVWRQLREKDEEIIRLNEILKQQQNGSRF